MFMLNFTFTIHWNSGLYILIALVLLTILIAIITSIMRRFYYKKAQSLLADKKYNEAINCLYKTRKLALGNKLLIDMTYLKIATTHLMLNSFNDFYSNINRVQHKKVLGFKYFWETMFIFLFPNDAISNSYTMQQLNDREFKDYIISQANLKYELFLNSDKTLYELQSFEFYDSVLKVAYAFNLEDYSYVSNEFDRLYLDLKNPLLIEYFNKIKATIDAQN